MIKEMHQRVTVSTPTRSHGEIVDLRERFAFFFIVPLLRTLIVQVVLEIVIDLLSLFIREFVEPLEIAVSEIVSKTGRVEIETTGLLRSDGAAVSGPVAAAGILGLLFRQESLDGSVEDEFIHDVCSAFAFGVILGFFVLAGSGFDPVVAVCRGGGDDAANGAQNHEGGRKMELHVWLCSRI